jgi:hypothetical protein
MDNDRFKQHFHDVASSVLLSCLERSPIQFRREHEAGAERVLSAIGRARTEEAAVLRSPVNRNGFLLGCLKYTDKRPEEHLIAGYGFRQASTTKIERVHHIVGGLHSVPIPLSVMRAMQDHYSKDNDSEIILFHNHPRWWPNAVFDNTPLASPADRNVLTRAVITPKQLLRTFANRGRILFYLGENGFVQQITLPTIASLFRAVAPARSAS